MKLYPYQNKIIEQIRKALYEKYKSILVVLPTGGGKTLIFSSIAKGASDKGNRVLILTHREEILEQTLAKLYLFEIIAGQVASGKPMTRDLIQVAMIQTSVHRLGYMKKPDLIIIDEAHHAVSPTWKKVIKYFGDIPRLGFTATPERADGAGLIEMFEYMIEGPTINQLVKEDYLSYPILYPPEKEYTQKFHIKRGDFDKDEMFKHYSKKYIVGNVIANYRKYLNYKPVICFCVSIKHCEQMMNEFIDAGYMAVMVYGNMPKKDREAALFGLANGSIHVVTSCDVISEGVDVPVMAGCILLRRTASLALYLQQVGRSLRKYEGKENAIILDHAGNYHIHGHILAERQWSLANEKRNKRKEKPPTTTSCPQCFAVWPGEPRKCPLCKFDFSKNEKVNTQQRKSPETIEGELCAVLPPDVDPEDVHDLSEFICRIQAYDAKKRQKAMLAMAFKLQERHKIDALGRVIGFKPGWSKWAWDYVNKNRSK